MAPELEAVAKEIEQRLEKKADNKLQYFQEAIMNLDSKLRDDEEDIGKLDKKIITLESNMGKIESLLNEINRKINALEALFNDPNNGVFAKQSNQWVHFATFLQKTEGEFGMNKKEHDELVEKLESVDKKISQTSKELDRLKVYSLIGFLILFLTGSNGAEKIIKLVFALL
ncbi:MAG: hypothetical protein N3A54_01530 [Patescibacteria group bacterium]|nr:hypothetical protein [Patescibacteria group bacterium]